MTPREERGLAIAQTQTLVQKGGAWIVPSVSGNGKYTVFPGVNKCTCPDHVEFGHICKHIHNVRFTISKTTQEVAMDGTDGWHGNPNNRKRDDHEDRRQEENLSAKLGDV